MEAMVLEKEEVVISTEVRIPMTKEQFLAWDVNGDFLYEYDNGFALQTAGM